MRRGVLFIVALPVMLAGLVTAAPAALAVSPHFGAGERHGERRRVTDRCPTGQQGPEPAQVSYTSVSITGTTNGIPQPIPGTFAVCALPAVGGACS